MTTTDETREALFDAVREYARAVEADTSGYYHPRWDLAQKLSVLATTKQQAINKAEAMLGTPARGYGWGWRYIIDAINEEADRG